jgi:hypothetical protein
MKLIGEGFSDTFGDGFRFSMGPAEGFWNDFIDDVEVGQILRGHFQCHGGIRHFGRIVPEDGGAAFRRYNRVDAVFQHDDAVGDAKGQGSSAAAFADDD